MWKTRIYHIYLVNALTGVMNAFQMPASSVAEGMIVPEGKYERASGMRYFSGSLLTIATPMLATFVYSIFGLKGVIFVDLTTFIFAFTVLAAWIHIPEQIEKSEQKKQSLLGGTKEGWNYLMTNKGICYLVLSMTCANLFSRKGRVFSINGMAVMFLFTGTLGALCTGVWYFTKEIRALENSKVD